MKQNVIVLCNDAGAAQHGRARASEFPDADVPNLRGKCGNSSQECGAPPCLIVVGGRNVILAAACCSRHLTGCSSLVYDWQCRTGSGLPRGGVSGVCWPAATGV